MKLKVKTANKLSTKLLNFLPFLKASVDELYEIIKETAKENPFLEVKNRKFVTISNLKNAITDEIEALTISKKTLYDELIDQIENSNLFPTKKSKSIAYEILKDISVEGFFEGDEEEISKRLNVDIKKVRQVRERFIYLNPLGIGAKDIKECMLFQLYNLDISKEVFNLAKSMIENLENIHKYDDSKYFKEAVKIIKNLKVTPAFDLMQDNEIIPEILVLNINGELQIRLNDEHYPEIEIKECDLTDEFCKRKIKEARNLVDALELRKSTLKKIALMIVEFQYEFFIGGVIKPMKIKDLADELDYSPSTISRAISNKYLLCNRGLIPLKSFFSTALDDEVSSREIKEEIKRLIKNEDRNKPLSDDKLTELINKKYNLNLVRRTISKYRDSLNIPTSRERKKLYKVKG